MPRLYVSTQTAAKLAKLLSEQDGRGAAVASSARRDVSRASSNYFYAQLTGWACQGGTHYDRFVYAWSEVTLSLSGTTFTATTKSGGRSGTTSAGFAFALTDMRNPDIKGMLSDGTNQARTGFPTGFVAQPIGGERSSRTTASGSCTNSVVVRLQAVTISGTTVYEILGVVHLAVDGACS